MAGSGAAVRKSLSILRILLLCLVCGKTTFGDGSFIDKERETWVRYLDS